MAGVMEKNKEEQARGAKKVGPIAPSKPHSIFKTEGGAGVIYRLEMINEVGE